MGKKAGIVKEPVFIAGPRVKKHSAFQKKRIWDFDDPPRASMPENSKVTVVTGFHPPAYELYGKNFLRTFEKHWPTEVDLVYYTEEPCGWTGRGKEMSLWTIPGVREFIDSHQAPMYHGKEPVPGWVKKDYAAGESYRYDAVKFCKQLFIPEFASRSLPDGAILAWFDADVVTFSDIPGNFVQSLLGNHDLVTVGRDRSHTDIGFWAVLIGPETRSLLKDIADSYRNGYVFRLPEWHSGFLFDHWKDQYKRDGRISHKSLTRGNGHVWFYCDLGKYTDHLKGPSRKKLGYSPERNGITIKAMMAANQPNPDPRSKHGP